MQTFIKDHPRELRYQTCLNLPDGVMTLGGGWAGQYFSDIYAFKNMRWAEIGQLLSVRFEFLSFLQK